MEDEIIESPYFTKDVAEAVTLATAGIPFADASKRCVNTYPEHILRKAGKTADQMVADGQPGEVWWAFRRVPELPRILEDFALIFKTDGGATEFPDITPRQCAQIAATALKNRALFSTDWKAAEPRVRIKRPGGFCEITKHTPQHVREAWGISAPQ